MHILSGERKGFHGCFVTIFRHFHELATPTRAFLPELDTLKPKSQVLNPEPETRNPKILSINSQPRSLSPLIAGSHKHNTKHWSANRTTCKAKRSEHTRRDTQVVEGSRPSPPKKNTSGEVSPPSWIWFLDTLCISLLTACGQTFGSK